MYTVVRDLEFFLESKLRYDPELYACILPAILDWSQWKERIPLNFEKFKLCLTLFFEKNKLTKNTKYST